MKVEDQIIKALTRRVITRASGSIRKTFNSIEEYSAWSGIRGDEENATKAWKAHEGFYSQSGIWVPPRVYITYAVENASKDTGHRKRIPAGTKMKRAVSEAIRDSVVGEFSGGHGFKKSTTDWYYKTERENPTRAFGSHTAPTAVLKELAKQMNENQKAVMVTTRANTPSTLARKRKRSTDPLVDYGKMREATRWGVSHGKD